jgi:outer membrane receptor for ferric coprogen and ferric-rhodotorulic acid
MWLKSTGISYGTDQSRDAHAVSPYAGAVYDLTSNVSLYASYTDIFNPQTEVDVNNRKLDPARGSSIEGGIKSEWFGGKLYATASLFRARQKGLASAIGAFGDPNGPCVNGPVGGTCYAGVDTTSRGFEIEIAGKVSDNWTVSGGYTGLKIEDQAGNPTRTFLPTKSLKLSTTYAVPRLNDLKFGAQLRWQNAIRYADSTVQAMGVVTGDVLLRQNSYAVLDLMAGIRLLDHVRATVNVRNVTDTKYLASLMWGQAYYAAPRSVAVTIGLDF